MNENTLADHTQPVDDLYSRKTDVYLDPPEGLVETLKYLGPGLILVGSIVGSGELIMTTKLGAQAGFVMLWFIILSCLLKVVVQTELARNTISSGETFLNVFNKLPGPSVQRPKWFTWEWLTCAVIAILVSVTLYMQGGREAGHGPWILAGMLGSMISAGILVSVFKPYSAASRLGDQQPIRMNWFLWIWMLCQMGMFVNGGAILGGVGQTIQLAFPDFLGEHGARYWAIAAAIFCGSLVLGGRYSFLERISVGMVATFTLITVICTVLLQWTDYAINFDDVMNGLIWNTESAVPETGVNNSQEIMKNRGYFGLPSPLTPGILLTILAVYAATGIGHWEMLSYTYWCIEKGYARNTGAEQPGDEWATRARGWIRVMYYDAFLTMIVYTSSTICFYLLGAAILNRDGLDPGGITTLSVLQGVYTESLGNWAATLFIVGAFFVLFSTTISAVASGSRIISDALCVVGFIDRQDYTARLRFIRITIVVSLSLNAYAYFLFEDPPLMLMITGLVAVFMYPTVGLGTLYLRYRGVDERIVPGNSITILLWICSIALGILSPAMAAASLAIRWGWIQL